MLRHVYLAGNDLMSHFSLFFSLYKPLWVLNVSSGDETACRGQLFVLERKFPSAAGCNPGRDLCSPSTKKALVFDVTLLQKLSQCRPIVLDSDV